MRGTVRRAILPLLLAILAASVLGPEVGFALDVHGSLTIPSDFASSTPLPTDAERARARYWEEWNGVLDPRPTRLDAARELAVVLTGDGSPSDGEQPPYRLHNGTLHPSTIVARSGAAMQIRNDDGVSYELFAEGNEEFGPIQTAPGNARPVTLSQPGNWPLRDRVHGHVRGHVHAVPNLIARAFVERGGDYTFRGVAAGTYQLRVFHGAREVHVQDVTVVEGTPLQVPAITLSAAAAAAAEPAPAPAAAGAAAPAEAAPAAAAP